MKNQDLSPDLNDLVERIPDKFNSYLVLGLLVFIVSLIGAGFLIKSPDIVHAEIRITSTMYPVTLKAKASGKLYFLIGTIPHECYPDQYIAMIENSADPMSVQKLYDYLLSINPLCGSDFHLDWECLSLGELSLYLFDFIQNLNEYNDMYSSYNQYLYEIDMAKMELKRDSALIEHYTKLLKDEIRIFEIRKKEYETDSILFAETAILENERNQSYMSFLEIRKQVLSENNMLYNAIYSADKERIKIQNLKHQYERKKQAVKEQLLTSYTTLISRILMWENQYVLKSDMYGIVELANFLTDKSFVSAGEPILTIIPKETIHFGVVVLPFKGAGKVKEGHRVNIKMLSYPYAEYGMLQGVVQNISKNPISEGYLAYVTLPDGLISTNGHHFTFAETMHGTADIVTEEKRLISKILYHIYTLLSISDEK